MISAIAPWIHAPPSRGRPSAGSPPPAAPGAKQDLARRAILVVDDDPETRDALRRVLEDEGYRVATAANGAEALLELAGERPAPSLMLVDLMMPVMDGWKLIAEVRKTEALSAVRVVVITAGGEHLLASAPVAAGYLTKPLDLTRLLQTVARLCGD